MQKVLIDFEVDRRFSNNISLSKYRLLHYYDMTILWYFDHFMTLLHEEIKKIWKNAEAIHEYIRNCLLQNIKKIYNFWKIKKWQIEHSEISEILFQIFSFPSFRSSPIAKIGNPDYKNSEKNFPWLPNFPSFKVSGHSLFSFAWLLCTVNLRLFFRI